MMPGLNRATHFMVVGAAICGSAILTCCFFQTGKPSALDLLERRIVDSGGYVEYQNSRISSMGFRFSEISSADLNQITGIDGAYDVRVFITHVDSRLLQWLDRMQYAVAITVYCRDCSESDSANILSHIKPGVSLFIDDGEATRCMDKFGTDITISGRTTFTTY
jgi:hypothetical protein